MFHVSMPIPKRLLTHLSRCNITHEVLPHRNVFTAFDLAQTLGEELDAVAKSVLVRADRELVLVSVPAGSRIDFDRLKKAVGAKKISIAPERAVRALKIAEGTTPPFGSLYGVRCVLDSGLAKCRRIVCRAGSTTESLRCDVADFIDAESPIIANVTEKRAKRKTKKAARPKAKARRRT